MSPLHNTRIAPELLSLFVYVFNSAQTVHTKNHQQIIVQTSFWFQTHHSEGQSSKGRNKWSFIYLFSSSASVQADLNIHLAL